MTSMNRLLRPFRRQVDPSAAARAMALQGVRHRKAKVRATCDAMRAEMGLPALRWPK
jgi:hypothetical protein